MLAALGMWPAALRGFRHAWRRDNFSVNSSTERHVHKLAALLPCAIASTSSLKARTDSLVLVTR